jgi:hypothetical protein
MTNRTAIRIGLQLIVATLLSAGCSSSDSDNCYAPKGLRGDAGSTTAALSGYAISPSFEHGLSLAAYAVVGEVTSVDPTQLMVTSRNRSDQEGFRVAGSRCLDFVQAGWAKTWLYDELDLAPFTVDAAALTEACVVSVHEAPTTLCLEPVPGSSPRFDQLTAELPKGLEDGVTGLLFLSPFREVTAPEVPLYRLGGFYVLQNGDLIDVDGVVIKEADWKARISEEFDERQATSKASLDK